MFHRLSLFLLVLFILSGCRVDKNFIFFPDRDITTTPFDVGLRYDDLTLTTKDHVRINAWFVPYPNAKTTLLWFHGNGGNLSNNVRQIKRFHDRLHINILIVDYREYGKSEGEVSEEGTYLDAEAAFLYLSLLQDRGRIVIYGHSLGCAVAIELALLRRAEGLILEAPFLSVREMAKVHYGWLPVGGLITTKYDNAKKIGKVDVPLLILHGDQDKTVPYAHGQKLFALAKNPKQFYTIKNAGHNDLDLVGGETYFQVLADFLSRE
jgi:hypothetical protein